RARAARDLQVAKVRIALLPALPISLPSSSAGASVQMGASNQPASQPLYQPPAPQVAGTDITGELLPGVSGQ
ncbi:MAG: hypothetical protein ACJ8CN_09435, partial [Gemmatimonadales bacterium]